MGFASHPVPWAYVSGDRLLIEAQDTIKGLGLPLDEIKIIPAFGKDNKNWRETLIAASALGIGLLVWEGFGDLVPPPGMKHQVREFLSSVSACCCEVTSDFPSGLTIIGIMESPKMKPAERYSSPRERISGVASWGYHTSTVMLIEAGNPMDVSDSSRVFHGSLKNASSFVSQGKFTSNGQLIFGPPNPTQPQTIEEMEAELAKVIGISTGKKRR